MPHANPWRRFRSTQGAALLAWVEVGNVGVIVEDPRSVGSAVRERVYSLWASSPALLAEAALAVGVLARKISTDPFPHLVLTGGPATRKALARCGHVPDPRRKRPSIKRSR